MYKAIQNPHTPLAQAHAHPEQVKRPLEEGVGHVVVVRGVVSKALVSGVVVLGAVVCGGLVSRAVVCEGVVLAVVVCRAMVSRLWYGGCGVGRRSVGV